MLQSKMTDAWRKCKYPIPVRPAAVLQKCDHVAHCCIFRLAVPASPWGSDGVEWLGCSQLVFSRAHTGQPSLLNFIKDVGA